MLNNNVLVSHSVDLNMNAKKVHFSRGFYTSTKLLLIFEKENILSREFYKHGWMGFLTFNNSSLPQP